MADEMEQFAKALAELTKKYPSAQPKAAAKKKTPPRPVPGSGAFKPTGRVTPKATYAGAAASAANKTETDKLDEMKLAQGHGDGVENAQPETTGRDLADRAAIGNPGNGFGLAGTAMGFGLGVPGLGVVGSALDVDRAVDDLDELEELTGVDFDVDQLSATTNAATFGLMGTSLDDQVSDHLGGMTGMTGQMGYDTTEAPPAATADLAAGLEAIGAQAAAAANEAGDGATGVDTGMDEGHDVGMDDTGSDDMGPSFHVGGVISDYDQIPGEEIRLPKHKFLEGEVVLNRPAVELIGGPAKAQALNKMAMEIAKARR